MFLSAVADFDSDHEALGGIQNEYERIRINLENKNIGAQESRLGLFAGTKIKILETEMSRQDGNNPGEP